METMSLQTVGGRQEKSRARTKELIEYYALTEKK